MSLIYKWKFDLFVIWIRYRHLKKFEIIIPKKLIIRCIRSEPIYPRKNVKQVRYRKKRSNFLFLRAEFLGDNAEKIKQ